MVKDLSEQLLLNYSEGSPVSAEGERGQDELLSRKQRLRDVGQVGCMHIQYVCVSYLTFEYFLHVTFSFCS